jgi:hypothetical protein
VADELGTGTSDRFRTHPLVVGVAALAALTAAVTLWATFVVLAYVWGYGIAGVVLGGLFLSVIAGMAWSRRAKSGVTSE